MMTRYVYTCRSTNISYWVTTQLVIFHNDGVRTQKIRLSAAVKTTPVPLYSSQSARALLHEIGPTYLIIETDQPGT